MIGSELDEAMDETMRETMDSISAEQPTITPVEDEVEEIVDEEPTGTVPSPDERERDENGRFISKPKDAEPLEAVAEEVEETADADGSAELPLETDTEVTETSPELINPPGSWTAQSKARWNEIPEFAKAEVLKREAESFRGVQQVAEKAHFADEINNLIEPYRATITAEGSTPEQTIQGMLNTAYLLRSNDPMQKVQMTINLAAQHGYLNELFAHFTQGGQNGQQPQFNPQHTLLEQEVQTLKQALEQQQQQQMKTEQSEAISAIQSFSTEANEDGSLAHPYYENVRELMGVLIESGQQQTLEGAYNAALWMSDDTRTLLQGQQQGDSERKRQEAAAERAAKAKKAGTVNIKAKGTHASATPDKPIGSVEDTMKETLENMKARNG